VDGGGESFPILMTEKAKEGGEGGEKINCFWWWSLVNKEVGECIGGRESRGSKKKGMEEKRAW